MKVAKYTHKAFDGGGIVKGWVIQDVYGNQHWVYFNGAELCVHDVEHWKGELQEIE